MSDLHSNFECKDDASRVTITVQVFQNGEPMGEYIAHVAAKDEQDAVDLFFSHARIDLGYKFLGHNGVIEPSALRLPAISY